MAIDNIVERLLYMDKSERHMAIRSAWNDYTKFISEIAHDIYKSCIEDFYDQYDPIVYKRHGFPEGKNLYQADAIEWSESELRIRLAANKLWRYGGKKDKRGKVLQAVVNGQRGARTNQPYEEERRNGPWPKPWYTSYPNDFSDYMEWSGVNGLVTMKDVMDYFAEHVIDETEDIFWDYLENYI